MRDKQEFTTPPESHLLVFGAVFLIGIYRESKRLERNWSPYKFLITTKKAYTSCQFETY